MAGTTVKIEPDIINWIIGKAQLEDIGSSVLKQLTMWQSGEKTPTFCQVETISKKINIPFGYFFLKTPPKEECKLLEYRTVNSIGIHDPSRNLIDTIDQMTEIQDWMRDYLIDNGSNKLEFVARFKDNCNSGQIVDNIRRTLNLTEEWFLQTRDSADSFKYLRKKLEENGILVMINGIVGQNTHRKLNINEFRAFTLIDPYAPLIFINACDSNNGKLFSLLHELVHIWIGTDSFYNDRYGTTEDVSRTEQICNTCAAELLVPERLFSDKWTSSYGTLADKCADLSHYFKCSKNVIVRRALDNSLIERQEYVSAISEFTKQFELWERKQQEKRSAGGDYYKTMGTRLDSRLIKALANSAQEGKTPYTEVYRLTNTNRVTFSNLINDFGGTLW